MAWLVAATLAACSNTRTAAPTVPAPANLCVGCHGGTDNDTGAPPMALDGAVATTDLSVGAHSSHVMAGPMAGPIGCAECHPATAFTSPTHRNGVVDIDFGPVASEGVTPTWSAATATCTVYCHGSAALGATNPTPTWTRVDGSQATCGACHGLPPPAHPALAPGVTVETCAACHPETVKPDGTIDVTSGTHVNGRIDGFAGHPAEWVVPGNPANHAAAARADVNACLGCHAVSAPAHVTNVTCDRCHTAAGGGGIPFTCSSCHGSAASSGPPRDTHGNTATTAIGVGAHQSHLTGTHGVALPLGCESCHVKPASAFEATHVNGVVEVTRYTGTDPALAAAVGNPAWNATSASCAASYCHGATLGGGTAMSPVWTRVDGTQAACGACHGLPPPVHPSLAPGVTAATCNACHAETVKPDGTLDVAAGKHVNGLVDGFTGHGAGWVLPGDPNFHGTAVANQGAQVCWSCHAAKPPATVSTLTCASCHDAIAGGVDWTTSCKGCHGTPDVNIAPPADAHGNSATTAIGVGAHQSHVTAASHLTVPLDCVYCHKKPTNVLDAGHMDGQAQVTGYTGTDPALIAALTDPTWSKDSATCSTSWCHGSYTGTFTYQRDDGSGTMETVQVPFAGTPRSPIWTVVNGTQGACGTCHALPPRNGAWHSGVHGGVYDYNGCNLCHPGALANGSGFSDPSQHMNGKVDVAPRFNASCFGCH